MPQAAIPTTEDEQISAWVNMKARLSVISSLYSDGTIHLSVSSALDLPTDAQVNFAAKAFGLSGDGFYEENPQGARARHFWKENKKECGATDSDHPDAVCQLKPNHEGHHNWSMHFWN